ncbi:MAG: amphi-Trp domain-containing protein [Caldimicrobium sp.]|nr:amphi-Trp domain-containing protein [Caldimicrobium sp.]MCX7874084.1 amphi-Trp domain-containing protein [Caldimicrobium sp.]MDW8093780.1 amphi-Trp domain-containing protein [Caldimicrobium sp.]
MAQKEKIEKQVNKKELLEYLRNLISQVEQGYVLIGDKKIELPESFELEIKYKEEDRKKEVEWEIEWKL